MIDGVYNLCWYMRRVRYNILVNYYLLYILYLHKYYIYT